MNTRKETMTRLASVIAAKPIFPYVNGAVCFFLAVLEVAALSRIARSYLACTSRQSELGKQINPDILRVD